MTLIFEPFGPMYEVSTRPSPRGVLTLRIPLSTAHVTNRVDIREQQRETEATSVAS
jgi:hypothetical protein